MYAELVSENHAAASRAGEHQVCPSRERRGRCNFQTAAHLLVLIIGDGQLHFGHAAERICAHAAKRDRVYETVGLHRDVLKICVVRSTMRDARDTEDLATRKIGGGIRSWKGENRGSNQRETNQE